MATESWSYDPDGDPPSFPPSEVVPPPTAHHPIPLGPPGYGDGPGDAIPPADDQPTVEVGGRPFEQDHRAPRRRTLLCPTCAASLDNWAGLPIVGDDDAPVHVTVGGQRVKLIPGMLERASAEVKLQIGRVKTYRRCPNGDKLPLDYGKRPVLIIPVMGRKAGGKTMFLGVLHQLIMEGAFTGLGWDVRLEDAPGVATYADELERYISSGDPKATLETSNLIYRFHPERGQTKFAGTDGFNLVMFDMPGERYAALADGHPRVQQVSIADGILLLIDADDVAKGTGAAEYSRMLNRLSNQLDDDHPYAGAFHRTSNWQYVPVAVGVSKSDRIATRLRPRYSRASDGPDAVMAAEVSERQLDDYCVSFLHDLGGSIGRTAVNRVFDRFIFSSWAFTSSYDEGSGRPQAINTLYLFMRLMRDVVGLVDAVEGHSGAMGGGHGG